MSIELRFKIADQAPQVVPLDEGRMLVGTLMSNHVVLRAPQIEPIHAMLEEEDGMWLVTDLGSESGVLLNGKRIDVEAKFKIGDKLKIGSVELVVAELTVPAAAMVPPPPPVLHSSGEDTSVAAAPSVPVPREQTSPVKPDAAPVLDASEFAGKSDTKARQPDATVKQDKSAPAGSEQRVEKKDILFSPRRARPGGDFLECVAYWGDTVLDVDLFHPTMKGYDSVTIGDTAKAHFIAAGSEHVVSHNLADFSGDGYRLRLRNGMEARIRKGGQVETIKDEAKISLGRRDIAHIKYGSVRYFLLFTRPPSITLPSSGPRDPFFFGLGLTVFFLFIFGIVPVVYLSEPPVKKDIQDDIYKIVYLPEKDKRPEKRPEPKVTVTEVKKAPDTPKPPPPKEVVKPATPKKTEVVKQPKPVEKPVPKPSDNKATQALTENREAPKQPTRPAAMPTQNLDKLAKAGAGMPSTAKTPDFKVAGPQNKEKLGPAGGARGGGNTKTGGERKGNQNFSTKGVEGPNNTKPSGVNLSNLGVGVGKVLSKTGPGAQHTDFTSSVGGAGGGAGSASKTVGMGGIGSKSSLGMGGTGGAVNNFGQGTGGAGGGLGGSGGLGGAGIGKGVGGEGRGRASVSIPPGDPVMGAGLTQQEVQMVVRANLNQIRHCYDQLLQRSPSASGRLTVNFVIGLDGRVTQASIADGTIADTIMRGCVTDRVRRWRFPQPRGGQPVDVRYPFNFTS